jgi:hypothetical protein
MKRFSTYLAELWDEPYPPGKLVVRTTKMFGSIRWRGLSVTRLPNGKTLEIEFVAIVPEGLAMKESSWEIMFTVDGSTKLTNDKSVNAARVLSTVVDATQEFLTWHRNYPRHLRIPSKRTEGKRDLLYRALIRKFGPGYGFTRTYAEVNPWREDDTEIQTTVSTRQ